MRMRPSADPRAPGIYQSFDSGGAATAVDREHPHRGLRRHHPEGADERSDAARRTGTSSSRSSAYAQDSYTSDSVHGFFLNGGTDCWVVRVAHSAPQGRARRASTTPRAPSTCRSTTGTSRRSRSARSTRARGATRSGSSACTPPGAQALLTRDLDIGSGEAHVNVDARLRGRRAVRIYDRENSDFIVITEVGDKLIKWAT